MLLHRYAAVLEHGDYFTDLASAAVTGIGQMPISCMSKEIAAIAQRSGHS